MAAPITETIEDMQKREETLRKQLETAKSSWRYTEEGTPELESHINTLECYVDDLNRFRKQLEES